MTISSLLLVGCGKMGSALLTRWQATFANATFDVIEPNTDNVHAPRTQVHAKLEDFSKDATPGIIIFAVKPQSLAEIFPAYKKRFGSDQLYLSIAAGKSLAFYQSHLGEHAHIVRAMPNTPAMLGKGMTALYAAPTLSQANRHIATQLMDAAGKTLWLEDEALMDAVTAISGSGPAYVFLFLDALTKAGISVGLPEAMAKTLALQTVSGSCALAKNASESFEQLRKNVTSPGGTTEAALKFLMQNDTFATLIAQAAQAAASRSKELK